MVALLAVAAVVIAVIAAGGGSGPGAARRTVPSARGGAGSAALASAAAVRQQAAAWVAGQVNADAIVACDPAMCAALQAHRIPASRLLVLRPGQGDPLGSDVVLATAAVRSEFGGRLASVYAPATLAVFGSGAAQAAVRVVAADGSAAYRVALSDDVRQRRAAGTLLVGNPGIHVQARARAMLVAGQVDARLLVTLATLAAAHPLNVISFGGEPGHGASPGMPVRSALISPAASGSARESPQALSQFLLAQRPPYHPSALSVVRIAPGRTALRVEFAAPSPLGLLASRG
jgi:hypothetical protein